MAGGWRRRTGLQGAGYRLPGRVERMGTKWLQSCSTSRTRRVTPAEFWDHVKVDLFPDAVPFTPKSQILALPVALLAVDFAYAIHSDVGDRTTAVRDQRRTGALRTELKNGDVVEVITPTTPNPTPPGWPLCAPDVPARRSATAVKTLAQK